MDELHENPVVVAIIHLEEFCDLVRLELRGVRGIFNGDLIRRRVGHQVKLEEELDEEVERRVRRDHSRDKTPSAHAWMTWNDTWGET